jgi:hypothetical protein
MTGQTTDTEKKTEQDPNKPAGSKKQGWKGNKQGPQSKHQSNKLSAFKGEITELNGHVYEVHNETAKANQFQKTTEAIASYVNRTMKCGNDMMNMIDNMADVDFDALKPKLTSASGDRVDELILQQEVNEYVKRKRTYYENRDKLYTIIWGQCSEALQAKLKGTKAFKTYNPIKCPLSLLKDIKQLSLKFENVTFKAFAIYDAKMALSSFYQTKQDTLHSYYMKFKDLTDALEHYGAELGNDIGLIRDIAERNGEKNVEDLDSNHPKFAQYKSEAREQYLAVCFLRGADRRKYGTFVTELENDYTKGTNHIPATVAAAYGLLDRVKLPDKSSLSRNDGSTPGGQQKGSQNNEVHGVVFVNKNGKIISKEVICYECGGNHYKGDPSCPNSKLNETDGYFSSFNPPNVAFLGAQPTRDNIADKDWILLDNQSSEHIFKNSSLVSNITAVSPGNGLIIHSNGGSQYTFHKASHDDFGTVWYNPRAITNILSFSKLRNAGYNLGYDHANDVFHLEINDRTYLFRQSPEGLYIYNHVTDSAICATSVADKQRMYTPRQIKRADEARTLYRMLGRPSERIFKHMLNHGLIHNTDITAEDVTRAHDIYGPEIGSLKGKTVRSTPQPVRLPVQVPLPDQIKMRHNRVTICADICHVDGLRFLTTISRNLHFGTIEYVPSLEQSSIVRGIMQVINIYHRRGFVVDWIFTDRAFEHIRDKLPSGVSLNVTAANEHVPEIERFIRVIKERVRAYITTSSIDPLPNILKIHLLQHVVQMLNLTVQPNGVSDILSPSSIVLGVKLDADIYCKVEFGTYCQVHDEPHPGNSVHTPRTLDAIALRPLGNLQGGYYFLCLNTWRVIARRQWTSLPMPAHVIDLLQTKALDERRTGPNYLAADYFHFRRADRSTITRLSDPDDHLLLYPFVDEGAAVTDDENPTPQPADSGADQGADLHHYQSLTEDEDQDDTDLSAVDDASMNDSNAHDAAAVDYDDEDEGDDACAPVNADVDEENDDDAPAHDDVSDDADSLSTNTTLPLADELLSPDDTPSDSLRATIQRVLPTCQRDAHAKDNIHADVTEENIIPMSSDERPSTSRYNMRPKVPPRYNIDDGLTYSDGIALTGISFGFACTQMTAKEGLKRFGKDAEDALLAEWKQLDNLNVYSGVHWNDLTPEERSRALRLVQLLKLKRCGRLKGRTCADGRKQRRYILPEDASSPTVSTEALLMTCVIDAKERRCVATADVPGAFLHAEMDDVVHVIVEGEQLDLLIKSNPEYKIFVHQDKRTGKDKAYLRLNKALYGTLKAARLFYDDLTSNLQAMGFTANPYDPCVMNRNIEGSQCTIAWHVDDLKISHKSKYVVERILKRLADIYGDLSITRGDKHTFVGMDMEFGKGEVKISMQSYLEESIEAFPEEITGTVSSPAANHLYTINPNAKKLPEHLREIFHSIVAKLLFVATRARPDLQPTISFLTSRCDKADVDDWKKLKRLLTYIKNTIDLKLRLRANAMNIVMWWADAAFAVRDDYKSQSGRGMSLGTGMIQCKSNKQSTTENSSTTAEVISSSDALIMIIWTTNFLKGQGYPVKDTILFQDNMSAIKLERNGRQSSSKRTRHLNIRHFFIKDRVDAGELNVKHCGTDDMIADYFTKPLQGNKFRKFRDLIMGVTDIDSTDQIRSVLESDLNWPNRNGQNNDGNDVREYENAKSESNSRQGVQLNS